MAKIVVMAVDASDQALRAFDWYCDNVHKQDNEIILVHCGEVKAPAMPSRDADGWRKAMDEAERKLQSLRETFETKLTEKNIKGKLVSEFGKPGEVIIKTAEDHNATMICMGSRGLGVVRRTILGSVSDYVLHHSKIPMIICPSRK